MQTIDSRLLSVFDAIYKTRSVTQAAASLGLGQPAVSIALGKLRELFNDPLFVRTVNGMEPTPRSEGLADKVRTALKAIEQVMGQHDNFDPASSERVFKVCMTDITQLVLLPLLWGKLLSIAPRIRIAVVPLDQHASLKLQTGEIDLAVGYLPELAAGFHQTILFKSIFVCMARRSHPRIKGTLGIAQFEAEQHALISAAGSAPLLLEREISRLGINRRVALTIPSYIGAALVVEQTDLLITIPSHLAHVLSGRAELNTYDPPMALPQYEVKQHWHERHHNDVGSKWLRQLISELLSPVAGQNGGSSRQFQL